MFYDKQQDRLVVSEVGLYRSGLGKCPEDPNHHTASQYVGKNVIMLYFYFIYLYECVITKDICLLGLLNTILLTRVVHTCCFPMG